MAKKPKPALKVKCFTFDAAAIAAALNISTEIVQKEFRDARVTSRFSEHWGAKLYDFAKHLNTNQAGSDGAVGVGELGTVDVSVKCLTRAGVKFQKSKFVGSGRKCTPANLMESLAETSKVLVVDIRDFPTVCFVPVDTKDLMAAASAGLLTPSGWNEVKFYGWLREKFTVSRVSVQL